MRKLTCIIALAAALASGSALAQQGATGETGSPGNSVDPTGTAPPTARMGNGTKEDVNTKREPSGVQTGRTGGGNAETRVQGTTSNGTTNGSNNR